VRFVTTFGAATLAIITAMPSAAQSDQLGVPGPLSFQSQDYALAWTSQPSDTYFKQEYVPDGQDVETFEDMIFVEAVVGTLAPMDAATVQIQSLEARKGSDPVVNYDVLQNEASGEVLLDFVISDLQANPVVVEWNAYRYLPLADGEGVVLVGISRRGYGEEGATAFMSGLGAMRSEAISALVNLELPAIAIEN
jgi:hypothetical protein